VLENVPLVKIFRQEIIRIEKKDRAAGYDFESEIRLYKTNNTTIDFRMKVTVNDTPTAREWETLADITGLVVMSQDLIPRRIKCRITYGDMVDDKHRSNTVEMDVTYQSGRTDSSKTIRIMSIPGPELAPERYAEVFTKMFSGEPYTQHFLGS
jgi:hypothetical protein